MKRAYALSLFVIMACAATADASFEQYAEKLQEQEKTVDGDHQVRGPLFEMLDANCNVNNALKAGLSGEPSGFAESLTSAEEKLRAVAKSLPAVAEKGRFRHLVKKTGVPVLALPSGETLPIRNGDEMLQAIATLAQHSADAIERIRTGKGSDDDFSLIADNSAVISQLILTFYNLKTT